MSRIPRNHITTSTFHIMAQSINKSYIFENHEDIIFYINNMLKLSEEHKIKIIAYCIMNNHAHILLEINQQKDLIKFMQRLNTRYGIYYNSKYNRIGYVFRDRYKSEGIYNEAHLRNCINYIHNNPVKAKICEKAYQYPYSNCYALLTTTTSYEYDFIDIEETKDVICKEVIQNFLTENNISLATLKQSNKKLFCLIKLLKKEYSLSLRKISQELNINREKVRQIYSNHK